MQKNTMTYNTCVEVLLVVCLLTTMITFGCASSKVRLEPSEIVALNESNGNELHIYHNDDINPNPDRGRFWNDSHYGRNKMTWNRSSN